MGDLVSVVIPAYNAGPTLAQALESILAQSGVSLEILVVDDASGDDTREVARQYEPRVRCLSLDTNSGGPAHPRNVGIRAARGDLISLFDADDVMLPRNLSYKVDFLARHREVPLVFANFVNFDDRGPARRDFLHNHERFHRMAKTAVGEGAYRLSSREAALTLLSDNFIGTSGVVFRRRLVEEIGEFDERYAYCDDLDFWLRAARRFELGYIDQVLHHRRLHSGALSSSEVAQFDQLAFRTRLLESCRTPEEQRAAKRRLADALFSLGFLHRTKGARKSALGCYWRSWRTRKSNWTPIRAMLRVLLPF